MPNSVGRLSSLQGADCSVHSWLRRQKRNWVPAGSRCSADQREPIDFFLPSPAERLALGPSSTKWAHEQQAPVCGFSEQKPATAASHCLLCFPLRLSLLTRLHPLCPCAYISVPVRQVSHSPPSRFQVTSSAKRPLRWAFR
jgi:hypothetical protein